MYIIILIFYSNATILIRYLLGLANIAIQPNQHSHKEFAHATQ